LNTDCKPDNFTPQNFATFQFDDIDRSQDPDTLDDSDTFVVLDHPEFLHKFSDNIIALLIVESSWAGAPSDAFGLFLVPESDTRYRRIGSWSSHDRRAVRAIQQREAIIVFLV
jgi:hypothetical protein